MASAGATIWLPDTKRFFGELSVIITRAQQQRNLTATQFGSLEFFVRRLEEYERTLCVLTLFLNPPCTKCLPELGAVLSIWRTWLSSSSSDMTLNSTSRPTGNPNSSLRRRTVRSETPRILATSAHRNPASPTKVSNWEANSHVDSVTPFCNMTLSCQQSLYFTNIQFRRLLHPVTNSQTDLCN